MYTLDTLHEQCTYPLPFADMRALSLYFLRVLVVQVVKQLPAHRVEAVIAFHCMILPGL